MFKSVLLATPSRTNAREDVARTNVRENVAHITAHPASFLLRVEGKTDREHKLVLFYCKKITSGLDYERSHDNVPRRHIRHTVRFLLYRNTSAEHTSMGQSYN